MLFSVYASRIHVTFSDIAVRKVGFVLAMCRHPAWSNRQRVTRQSVAGRESPIPDSASRLHYGLVDLNNFVSFNNETHEDWSIKENAVSNRLNM